MKMSQDQIARAHALYVALGEVLSTEKDAAVMAAALSATTAWAAGLMRDPTRFAIDVARMTGKAMAAEADGRMPRTVPPAGRH